MAIATGIPAPDFSLRSFSSEGPVTLSEQRGHTVVLLFFPGAFTGVCTTELCSATGDLNAYESLGAKVFGVSIDSTFAQKAWATANNITVPLLSDYNHDVVRAYDLELANFAGLGGPSSKRAVVVIDREGIVRYVQVTPAPGDLPDFDAVKAAVAAL